MNKKILISLLALFISLPSIAAEKVKVKVGKVKAKINTDKENNTVSISLSGTIITIGYGYSKTVIKGLSTRSTNVLQSIQFDLGEDLEAGKTYTFDNTNNVPILTASKTNVKTTIGYSTTGLANDPDASGSLKVKSYDSETGEIKATFKAVVAPIQFTKNTKVTDKAKGVPVKAVINAVVD